MNRPRLWILLSLVSCTGALDSADKVHDLRLLAMRVEPPEESVAMPSPFTASALVADPAGAGRTIHCRWVTCAQLDSDTNRCLDGSPNFKELERQDVIASERGAEPTIQVTPDPVLLAAVAKLDPYRGLGGVRQPVQLELSAGEESVVGIKRMVFLLPMGPDPVALNVNPVMGELAFNDAGWAPDASVNFVAPPPKTTRMGMVGAAKNQVAVLEDKSLRQDYVVTTFTGERRTLHEAWRYNFFATRGGFSPATAGGSSPIGAQDGGLEANWQPNDGEDGGVAIVWVVVRDGRGGETWTSRQAIAP